MRLTQCNGQSANNSIQRKQAHHTHGSENLMRKTRKEVLPELDNLLILFAGTDAAKLKGTENG
tara:strand:- start:5438 stop:5626 length:189 start_codon:yes stop_codon:yes gene_type:complete